MSEANEAICIFCYRDRLGAATAAMQHDHLDDVAILRRFRRKFTALAAQNAAPQSVAGAAPIVSEQARRCEWCGEIAKEHIISVKKPPHAFCLAKGTP